VRFFACAARPEPSESITSFLAPCGILEGYDLIVHVGVGARGGLGLEKRGRKEGHLIPDYEGKLAPVVGPYEKGGKYALGNQVLLSDAIRHKIERASGGSSGSEPDGPDTKVLALIEEAQMGDRLPSHIRELTIDLACP